MGSLSSRPSVPSVTQPQVVYVPQPQTPTPIATGDPQEESESEASANLRKDNLLRRDRGRLGTIRTGFQGLLGLVDNNAQRKTLLGE